MIITSKNHTGTLYIFTTSDERVVLETTDYREIQNIANGNAIEMDGKIILNNSTYKVRHIAIVPSGSDDSRKVNDTAGEVNDYTIQTWVYVVKE